MHEWKTTARTLLFTSRDNLCMQNTKLYIKRKFSELTSSRKFVKYILCAFILIQICVYALSSSVQTINYRSNKDISKLSQSNRNFKHSNERGIKSLGDTAEFNFVKKAKFEDFHNQLLNGEFGCMLLMSCLHNPYSKHNVIREISLE